MTQKRALIGLDAAELRFIQANLAALPNLARTLSGGKVFELRSTAGHMPGSAWPTFYTGEMPGRHGIYHHLQWDPATMKMRRVINAWRPTKPFWRTLDEKGMRVISFDVQAVSPAPLPNGIEIVSWGSHDQLAPFQAFPAAVGRELHERFGRHPMGAEIPVTKSHQELQRIKKNLIEGAAVKGRACQYLAQAHPWDLFIAVFGESHRGGHLFWPGSEGESSEDLLEIYQAIDRAVGALLDLLRKQGAAVTVFALHGMGFNTSQEHFTRSVMDRANAHYLQKNPHVPLRRFKFPIIQVLRERVPAGIQNVVAKMVPVAVRDWVVGHQVISGLHWEVTPGFAVLTDLHAYIRANVCGREARGWFEPGSADLASYVDWLERCFLSLRNSSDGTPLVKEVVRTDAVYPGPSRHFLPDLIVVWNDMRAVSHATSDLLGSFTAELATGRSGNHRPEGFVIIANDDTALQAVAPPQGIADLASLISRAL